MPLIGRGGGVRHYHKELVATAAYNAADTECDATLPGNNGYKCAERVRGQDLQGAGGR